MNMYEIKLRKRDNRLITTFIVAPSAVEAIESAERALKGQARSCWPVEWVRG